MTVSLAMFDIFTSELPAPGARSLDPKERPARDDQ
jgi:hypothetical protein